MNYFPSASGTLKIEGNFIYEWFTRRFKELLDNADQDFADSYTYIASSSDPYPVPESGTREPHGDIDTGISWYQISIIETMVILTFFSCSVSQQVHDQLYCSKMWF